MKKCTIIAVFLLTNVFTSFAQRDLEGGFIKESDYKADTVVLSDCKYILDTFMEGVAVYIYNAKNHPGRDDVQWADGRCIGLDEPLEPIVYTKTLVDRLYAITDNAFTDEQIEKFGKDFFQITLNISSATGEVTDVYFMILPKTYYANVPIEVFRKMELQFKDIVFELTEQVRNMNYVYVSWETTPKRRAVAEEETTNSNSNGTQTDLGNSVLGGGTVKGSGLLTPTAGGRIEP